MQQSAMHNATIQKTTFFELGVTSTVQTFTDYFATEVQVFISDLFSLFILLQVQKRAKDDLPSIKRQKNLEDTNSGSWFHQDKQGAEVLHTNENSDHPSQHLSSSKNKLEESKKNYVSKKVSWTRPSSYTNPSSLKFCSDYKDGF